MENAVDRSKMPGRRGRPRQFGDPDLNNRQNYYQTEYSNRKCAC